MMFWHEWWSIYIAYDTISRILLCLVHSSRIHLLVIERGNVASLRIQISVICCHQILPFSVRSARVVTYYLSLGLFWRTLLYHQPHQKVRRGFNENFFAWQHHYYASKGENTRFSISYLKCVGISYERTLGKTTLINKPCQLGTMKSHVPCDLFFFCRHT